MQLIFLIRGIMSFHLSGRKKKKKAPQSNHICTRIMYIILTAFSFHFLHPCSKLIVSPGPPTPFINPSLLIDNSAVASCNSHTTLWAFSFQYVGTLLLDCFGTLLFTRNGNLTSSRWHVFQNRGFFPITLREGRAVRGHFVRLHQLIASGIMYHRKNNPRSS